MDDDERELRLDRIRAGDVEAIRLWTEDDEVCHSELARMALRGLLAEVDRARRYEAVLRTYGRALDACDHASDADAEYEADAATEEAFDKLVETAMGLAAASRTEESESDPEQRQRYDVFALTSCERPPRLIGEAEEVGEEGQLQTRNTILVRLDALPLGGSLVLRKRAAK